MSFTCEEEWNGRKGSWDFRAPKWQRTYVRIFHLYGTDPINDNEASSVAFMAGSYPLAGSHPSDPLALLGSIDCTQEAADALKWKVTLTYTNDFDPGWVVADPTQRPVIFKMASRKEKKALDQAWLDQLNEDGSVSAVLTNVLNSAGQPYDPPLERDQNIQQFQAIANYATANVNWYVISAYEGAVNLDYYRGFPPGSLKIESVDMGEELYESGIAYYTLTWHLELNITNLGLGGLPGGWRDTQVLDRGLYENIPYVRQNAEGLANALAALNELTAQGQALAAQLADLNAQSTQAEAAMLAAAAAATAAGVQNPYLTDAATRDAHSQFIDITDTITAQQQLIDANEQAVFAAQLVVEQANRQNILLPVPYGDPVPAQGVTWQLSPIRDPQGHPVTQPYPLNGQGRRIPQPPPGEQLIPFYKPWNLYGDKLMTFTGVLP